MDIARCLLNDQLYYALGFSQLPVGEIEEKRQHLVCPVCDAAAFFRKAAASGQAACFGARPHVPGCNMAAPVALRIVDGAGNLEDRIYNPGHRIVVDLAFGAAAQVNVDAVGADVNGGGRGARRFVGDGPRPDADAHRRLRPLLRTLVEAPDFATSLVEIEVPGNDPTPAARFFLNFRDINGNHPGTRGFWGMTASAAYDRGDLWINSGGRAAFSILLREPVAAQVLQRYRIADLEDFAGAYVLAIGSQLSTGWGKSFCIPESAEHVAIVFAD
ncbi:hypothetical protein M4R22_10925 [Acidovorax sp. GBBC 3334]|uniref:hypothetical protein n=1 Tax=Acidovorax sp. GBBC 3334 TaxID=2940496 RepID=UPI0023043928|nr:hypothetical protein [Acidovorax sp. GBBC 3334]MDA8455274.1 hypothetical protein [Acidovorax sp. GBBC 3334]